MSAPTCHDAPEVLEIQAARPALSDLVRRAVEHDAVTHIGRRRADEAVVVATSRFQRGEEALAILEALGLGSIELLREAVEAARARRAADPFASLRTMLAERAAAPAPAAVATPAPGRRLVATSLTGPEEDRESESMTWEAMAALGGAAAGGSEGGRRPLPVARRRPER